MSKSRYEYVKSYESHASCLPSTFILVRIDGKGFSKFTALNNFLKPNDEPALHLMNLAASAVCARFHSVFLAYGQSDEFSFVFDRSCDLFKRRKEKIVTTLVSVFTAVYNMEFEPVMGRKMKGLAIFDGRVVEYPTLKSMRDYFSWRQVDCHINNMFNTAFWLLVQKGGKSTTQAEKILRDTVSKEKQEIMHGQFGVNYNEENEMNKKGSLVVRRWAADPKKVLKMKALLEEGKILKLKEPRKKLRYDVEHVDLIQVGFWEKEFPELFKEDH